VVVNIEQAFLQDIIAHLDDDAPRLIYADWLEEHGKPERAEFIRVQCRLAALGEDDPAQPALEEPERRLLNAHQEEWRKELPTFPGIDFEDQFERGFVYGFYSLYIKPFHEHAETVLARTPVQRARFYRLKQPNVRRLAASPHLARLAELDVRCNHLGNEKVRLLVHSPHLVRLRSLDLGASALHDDGVRAVVEAPVFGQLKELELSDNLIGPEGVRALTASPRFNLRRLALGGNRGLGDAGAIALATSPAVRSLEGLSLSQTNLGLAGVEALASSPHLAGLRELDLGRNPLRDAEARVLAESPHLGQLRQLSMIVAAYPLGARLTAAGKEALRARFGERVHW
jgi:uncharacterized protein (TIGR02996 family)